MTGDPTLTEVLTGVTCNQPALAESPVAVIEIALVLDVVILTLSNAELPVCATSGTTVLDALIELLPPPPIEPKLKATVIVVPTAFAGDVGVNVTVAVYCFPDTSPIVLPKLRLSGMPVEPLVGTMSHWAPAGVIDVVAAVNEMGSPVLLETATCVPEDELFHVIVLGVACKAGCADAEAAKAKASAIKKRYL